MYFDGSGIINNSYQSIFQNILERNIGLPVIEIEGAFVCSKMAPGEVGGFIELITKDRVISKGTNEVLREAYAELERAELEEEEPINLVKKEGTGGNNDFKMDPDGNSVWIDVGPVSIYIVPGSETVTIDLFPGNGQGQQPLDSASATYREAQALIDDNEETNGPR